MVEMFRHQRHTLRTKLRHIPAPVQSPVHSLGRFAREHRLISREICVSNFSIPEICVSNVEGGRYSSFSATTPRSFKNHMLDAGYLVVRNSARDIQSKSSFIRGKVHILAAFPIEHARREAHLYAHHGQSGVTRAKRKTSTGKRAPLHSDNRSKNRKAVLQNCGKSRMRFLTCSERCQRPRLTPPPARLPPKVFSFQQKIAHETAVVNSTSFIAFSAGARREKTAAVGSPLCEITKSRCVTLWIYIPCGRKPNPLGMFCSSSLRQNIPNSVPKSTENDGFRTENGEFHAKNGGFYADSTSSISSRSRSTASISPP